MPNPVRDVIDAKGCVPCDGSPNQFSLARHGRDDNADENEHLTNCIANGGCLGALSNEQHSGDYGTHNASGCHCSHKLELELVDRLVPDEQRGNCNEKAHEYTGMELAGQTSPSPGVKGNGQSSECNVQNQQPSK